MTRSFLALTFTLAFGIAAAPPAHGYDFAWIGKIELDAEGLQHADPDQRVKAAEDLGKYEIELVKDHLLTALAEDASQRVRNVAGRILAKNGVEEAAPIVIEWLNDPDPEVKKTAADILADIGTREAIAALIRTLGDVDPDVRLRAVLALGRIGTPAVVVPLVGRLEDDKPNVRRHAIEQLQKIGDKRAVIQMVGAFNDSSVEVRVAAVAAVGHLGDPAAIPALLRHVDDSLDKVGLAAISSLGNLGAVEAVDLLVDRLRRTAADTELKATIAYALGKIVGKAQPSDSERASAARRRAAAALVAALADPTLSGAAREALRTAGKAAVPALVAHLEGKIDGDPETAVLLLRDQADPRATDALIDELNRGRIAQELVLSALAATGDKRAMVPILSLLSSDDAAVRLRAMQALAPLLDGSGRAADVIRRRLSDDNLEIRILAADYLGRMRAASAVDALIPLARPGHELRLRAAAIEALGEIGDRRAAMPLLSILRDGPSALHPAIANALIYLAAPDSVDPLLELLARPEPRPLPRHEVARILGGVLRDHDHEPARAALIDLARTGSRDESLAAIGALAAMGSKSAASALRDLARGRDPHRRRAALQALGDVGADDSRAVLADALRSNDDRIAAAAAWSLGKLGGTAQVDALLDAARGRGWATAINASAALALIGPKDRADELRKLLYHRVRQVRVNAAEIAGRLDLDAAGPLLAELLVDDPSRMVRAAAARALSRVDRSEKTLALLRARAEADADAGVRAAAKAAAAGPFEPAKRSDWRNFLVVDPDNGDAPVEQEPYFVLGADGLITAFYTDSRGQAWEEAFPAGDHVVAAKTSSEQF